MSFLMAKEKRTVDILERKKKKTSKDFAEVIYSRTLAAIYDFLYVFSLFQKTIREEDKYHQGEAWESLSDKQREVLLLRIEEVEEILSKMKEKISS